jgi:hypothetical protein
MTQASSNPSALKMIWKTDARLVSLFIKKIRHLEKLNIWQH